MFTGADFALRALRIGSVLGRRRYRGGPLHVLVETPGVFSPSRVSPGSIGFAIRRFTSEYGITVAPPQICFSLNRLLQGIHHPGIGGVTVNRPRGYVVIFGDAPCRQMLQ